MVAGSSEEAGTEVLTTPVGKVAEVEEVDRGRRRKKMGDS